MGKWLDALLAGSSPQREYTELEKRKKLRELEWNRLLGNEQWSKIDSELSVGEKIASAIEPALDPIASGVANLQGVFNVGTSGTGRLFEWTDRWDEAKALNEKAFEELFKRKPENDVERMGTDPGIGELVFMPKEDDGPIEGVLKNVGMLGLNIATDPLTYTPAGIGKAFKVASKLGPVAAKPKNVLGLAKIAMGEPLLKEAKEAFRAGNKLKGLGKSVMFTLGGTPAGLVYAPQLVRGLGDSVGQMVTGDTWDEKLAGALGTGLYGTFAFLGYKGVKDTVKEINAKRIFESPKKLDKALVEESARNAFLTAELPPGFATDEHIKKSMASLGLSAQGWRDSVLKFAGEEFDKSYRGDVSKKEAARAKYMQLHSSLIDSWIKERVGAEGKADKTVRSLLKVESKPEGTPIESEIKRVIDLTHGDALRSEMTGVLSRLTDFATGSRLEKMSREGDTVAGAILAKNFKDAMRPVVGQDVTLPAIVERRAQRLMYENRNMSPQKAFQTALGEITDGLVSHYKEGFDTSDVELSRAALQQKIQSEDLFSVSIPEASKASDLYGRSALAQFSREALGVQMRNAFPGLTEEVYGALDKLMDTIAVRQVDKYPDRYKTEADWYASTFDSIRKGDDQVIERLLKANPDRIYRDSLNEIEARDAGARVTKGDREIPPASVLDRWALFSGAEEGKTPAGAAEFLADQRAIVWAFEQADASVAIHELSHVFLRQMERLGDPHMADVKKALGKTEMDVLTRKDHEVFAKAFEKHSMTGTSEFDERNELFAPFNAWLRALYPAMAQEMGREKISPNLRKAMDRIVLDGLSARIAKQRITEANALSVPNKKGIVQVGPIMKALKDQADLKQRIEAGTRLTDEVEEAVAAPVESEPRSYRSVGEIREKLKQQRAARDRWMDGDRSEYAPPGETEYVLFSDQSVSRAVASALEVRGDGSEAEQKLRGMISSASDIQGQVPDLWTRTRKIIDSVLSRPFWKHWPGMSVSIEGKTAPLVKVADKAGIDGSLTDAADLATRQPVDIERDLTLGTVKTDRFTLKPEYSGEAFPKELVGLTPEQSQEFTIIALAERGKETIAKVLDRNAQYQQEKMMWREELDMAEEMLKLDPENEEIKQGIAEMKRNEPKPPKSLGWNIEDARQYNLAAENIRRRIGDDAYNAYLRLLDRLVDWSNRSVVDALVEVGYLSSTAAEKLKSYSKFAPITYADRLIQKATGVDPNTMERIMDAPGEASGVMETAEAVEAWLTDLGIPPEAADNAPSANVTKRRTSVSASTNRPILDVVDAAIHRAVIAKGITARARMTNLVPDLMVRGLLTKRDPSHRLALSPEGAEIALSNATPVKDQPVKRPMLIYVDGELVHLKHDPEVAADLRSRHGGGKDDTVTVFYEMPVLAKDEKGKYIIDDTTMQYVPLLDAEGKIVTERVPVKFAVDKGTALSVSLINPRAANVTMGAAWDMVKGAADLYNKVVSKPILKKPAEWRRKVVTSLPGFALRQISPFRDPFNHWARNPKTFPYGKMVKGMASKMFLGKDVTPRFAEALRKIGANDLADGIMREDVLYRYAEDVSRKPTHMGTVGEATILPEVSAARLRVENADAPPASFLLGRREYLNRKDHFANARTQYAKMGKAIFDDITGFTAHAQDSPTRIASAMDVGRSALEGVDINDKAAVTRAMAGARGEMAAAHATSNLDFSNMAAFSSALNGMEMFASAKLVDTGAMMKAMRRNPVSFWTKVGVGVIVPAIIEGLSTVDDADEDNRSTVSQLLWAKFNVGDRYFYLPRHQGIFRPLNYAVREAVRNMAKEDPNWRETMYNTYISLGEGVPFMDYMVQAQEGDVSDYQGGGPIRGAASALGQLARTAAPVGVEPLVDIGFNERSFFGGNITPEYEKSQVFLEYRGDNRYSQAFRKLASHANLDAYQLEYIARQYGGEYSKVGMNNFTNSPQDINLLWNPPDRPIGMRSKPYHDWIAADKAYSSAKKQFKEKEDSPEGMQILARHPYLEDQDVDDVFKEHNSYLKEVKTEIRELKKLPKTEENLAMIEELEAQMTYETLKRMAVLRMVNDGRYKGLFK